MVVLAFVAFLTLVLAWLVAPSGAIAQESAAPLVSSVGSLEAPASPG